VVKKRALLGLLVLLFLLTGCDQKITVSFPREQQWSIKTVADFKDDVIEGIGETAGSMFGVPISGKLFDTETLLQPVMSMMDSAFAQQGIDFTWSYAADKLQYRISGDTFGQLGATDAGSFASLTQVGDNTYRLMLDYSALGEEFMMISGYLYNTTITINAGKIIQSNADKQTRSSATWNNPTSIDVTFQPGSSAAILPVLAGVGGVGLLALLIKLLSGAGGGVVCPSCGKKNKKGSTECHSCGAWM
jgi:hypothetical protein